jgi:hypothetical protein
MMIKTFKALADLGAPTITAIKNDHEALRRHFGLEEQGHYSATMLYDKLIDNIKTTLIPVADEPQLKREELLDLIAALVYESVLDGVDNSAYLTWLRIVTSKEPLYKSFSESQAWIAAMNCAKDYELIYPETYQTTLATLRDNFAKDFDIGSAAAELRKLGCTVTIKDTALEYSSGLEDVVYMIEQHIIEYGPIAFIQAILNFLVNQNVYVPEYRRYIIRNEVSFLSAQNAPMLPFGFLLNLAVKHIGKPETSLKPAKANILMAKIELKAKLIGTIADARAYGIWELQFQTADTLLDTMRSFALFDGNFTFPSSDFSDVISYMEQLFNWQDEARFKAHYGFTKNDMITITRLIDQFIGNNGPHIIYASDVQKQLKFLEKEQVTQILTHLSHEAGKINTEFILTEHYNRIDFGFKPLIRLSPTKFLLCDKSWCAAAFYEVLANLVRTLDSEEHESNKKIGLALEAFVHTKLKEKNITFSYGDYVKDCKIKGEADGIIEAENAIILLEIKKKVLTRRSKTGSAVAVIIDLAGSLLEAQIQAGRTELLLRQQGYIELESNGQVNKVYYNNREIERVALTQWDFGSFQDRGIINNILSILMGTSYTLTKEGNKSDTDAFKKMNKLRNIHQSQAEQLHEIDPRFDHYPYFSCWFLSVPQLMVLLRYSNNNEEFYEALRATKGVTMSTMNFYFEFLYSFIRSPKRTQI